MKHKGMILLIIAAGLLLAPLSTAASGSTGVDEALVAAADSQEADQENAGLSFLDLSMIVMIILVTIYFAVLFFKEWRQVH